MRLRNPGTTQAAIDAVGEMLRREQAVLVTSARDVIDTLTTTRPATAG